MATLTTISNIITKIADEVLDLDKKLHARLLHDTSLDTLYNDTRTKVVTGNLVEGIATAIYNHLSDEKNQHAAFSVPPISSPPYLNSFSEKSLLKDIAARVLSLGLDEETLLTTLQSQRSIERPKPSEQFAFEGRVPSMNGKMLLGEVAAQKFGIKADLSSPQEVLKAVYEKQGNERFNTANSQTGCQLHYLAS